MTVIEMARELGKKIQEEESYVLLNIAQKAVEDDDELQEKIEEDLMAKFDEVMPMIESGKSDVAEALVLSIFEEKDSCRAILGENGSSDFLKKVIDKSRKSSFVKYETLGMDKKDFGAVFTFVTSGSIGVIREWVMNDFDKKPDTVIETIRKVSSQGIQGFLKK